MNFLYTITTWLKNGDIPRIALSYVMISQRIWILVFFSLLVIPFLFSSDANAISVTWGSIFQNINVGGFVPGGGPWGNNTMTVIDGNYTSLASITVQVNSTTDPSGITLTLYNSPGAFNTFRNHDLIYTNGSNTFTTSSTQTVSVLDTAFPNNPLVPDTIISGPISTDGIQVFSSTDPTTGIFLNMTETGPNTSIYSNTLKFTTGSSVNGSAISVHPGDIVSIINLDGSLPDLNIANELITPNPDPATGALPAKFGDTVTVTYKGVRADALINAGYGGGGGGGGLIRPSLVLDILASIVGGSPYVVSPPSFGGSYYHYSDGLVLNQADKKETFDISGYNNEIPKQVLVSGKNTSMTFKTFESYDPKAIVHMGLYLIPRGQDMITPNSIASIVWDKNSHLEVNDPGHILSNATATSVSDGKFQYTKFDFVPTKSYDKMSFLARAWNDHMYSTDVRLHDAVETPEPTKTLPAGTVRYDNFGDLQAELEKDGFYNPNILNHIRDTKSVFGSTGNGCVYWLYDTINHTVTLVIEDKDENNLASITRGLEPFAVEKKGDYKFMHFTVKQLNGWNDQEIKDAMQSEASKAMASALEKGIMPHSNW